MASLSLLVPTRGVPERVRIRDHSLEFVGREDSDFGEYLTGVYSTHSKQMALVCAAAWSRDRALASGHNRMLMLDVNYRVDNYDRTRSQVTAEILQETGWLHMERMASDYREKVREMWLEWIKGDVPHAAWVRAQDLPLVDLALKWPKYVARMLREEPVIRGIVHPVHPSIDPSVVLWVATVRLDQPDRLERAMLRYLPDVPVEV